MSQWVWHVRELFLFDGHGWLDWLSVWTSSNVMVFAGNGDFLVKLKKKIEWGKSQLYVLPDLQKSVKNFIVHSLYISETMPIMPRNKSLYNAHVHTVWTYAFQFFIFYVKPKFKYLFKNVLIRNNYACINLCFPENLLSKFTAILGAVIC